MKLFWKYCVESWEYQFNFHGRANRKQFGLMWASTAAVAIIIMIIVAIIAAKGNYDTVVNSSRVSYTLGIELKFAMVAISVRRMQDLGKEGLLKYLGLVLFIPDCLISLVHICSSQEALFEMQMQSSGAFMTAVGVIVCVGGTIFNVFLCCLKGMPGPNKFGNPPKDETDFYDIGVWQDPEVYDQAGLDLSESNLQQSQLYRPESAFRPVTSTSSNKQSSQNSLSDTLLCPKCGQSVNNEWSVCPFCSQDLSSIKKFMVIFSDDNGTLLKSEQVLVGKVPVPPTNPKKPSDARHSYEFAGWTPEVKPVSGDAKYVAVYKTVEKTHKVTFVDEDGSVLKTENVLFGEVPKPPTDPKKPSNARHTYEFAGWTPEVKPVISSDVMYTAVYTVKDVIAPISTTESQSKESAEKHCPKCNRVVSEKWALCPFCGQGLSSKQNTCCPKCGMDVESDWKLCPSCGQNLQNKQQNFNGNERGIHALVFTCCPNCGMDVEPGWLACPGCGEDLKA